MHDDEYIVAAAARSGSGGVKLLLTIRHVFLEHDPELSDNDTAGVIRITKVTLCS